MWRVRGAQFLSLLWFLIPVATLRFNNSPEGLTELTESCYIHSFSLGKSLQSRDRASCQQSFHAVSWWSQGICENTCRLLPTREACLSPVCRVFTGAPLCIHGCFIDCPNGWSQSPGWLITCDPWITLLAFLVKPAPTIRCGQIPILNNFLTTCLIQGLQANKNYLQKLRAKARIFLGKVIPVGSVHPYLLLCCSQ